MLSEVPCRCTPGIRCPALNIMNASSNLVTADVHGSTALKHARSTHQHLRTGDGAQKELKDHFSY